MWDCYCGQSFKDGRVRTKHSFTCPDYQLRQARYGFLLNKVWIEALVEARYDLHRTDEYGNRWDLWNEIEDFFGAWMDSVAHGS